LATPAGFLFRHVALLSLHAWLFVRRRRRALQAVGRVIGQPGPHEARGGWLATPIERPRNYWRGVANSKTLAIANLKGGVGKTTFAADLGAYLAKAWQKRVLAIDLDFQGSLSAMAFPRRGLAAHQSSLAP
jgi:Mrp family chromosome partitioning ATPase